MSGPLLRQLPTAGLARRHLHLAGVVGMQQVERGPRIAAYRAMLVSDHHGF
jgi:hypothetical protein